MNTDDLWKDIDAVFSFPNREPGDIDANQIEIRYDVSQTSALRKMHKLAASGEYKIITVKDITSATGRRMVLRKIQAQ